VTASLEDSEQIAKIAHLFSVNFHCRQIAMGDFNFLLRLSLRLSLSLNLGLSTYLSQKVKWFRWAKTLRLTRII